jgi:hypothetical protein
MNTRDTPGSGGKPRAAAAHNAADLGTRMIVWIWDASGPAADACGVAGTPEAARSAAGSLVTSGQADAASVEQAAIVLGIALTYDYCTTGRAWVARLEAGRLTWAPATRPERSAP